MLKWKFDETVVIEGIIEQQKKSGRIPAIDIQQGPGLLKRHQRKLYNSAINFSAPIGKEDCGRYNPPNGSVAIWYASDSALTAAAEAYGRLFHLKGIKSYPVSTLSQHFMCSVDILRPVKVIDVVALCELLHIPLDSLENEDYTFPQWLMEHLYTNYGRDYDGIAYTSRHKRYKRCYAFWERPDSTPAFTDTLQGMWSYAKYVETDVNIFPKGWHKRTMSGEEMFEELLGFVITPEPI